MLTTNNILLAEHDEKTREDISRLLASGGFDIAFAFTGEEARQRFNQQPFALAIVAMHLPDMSGFELCREIRAQSQTPVILILDQCDDLNIQDGLDAGAADFIIQPVRENELVARVRIVLKRTSTPLALPAWILHNGDDLLLDLRSHCIIKKGRSLPLTRTELRLLSYLMRNCGNTVTKEDLLVNVWGCNNVAGDLNLVDTAIKRLRRVVEDDPKAPRYIKTVWGVGYRFEG